MRFHGGLYRALAVPAIALVLAVCSSGGGGGSPVDGDGNGGGTLPPGDVTLTASLTFQPPNFTVAAGEQVVWVNAGGEPHTITPDGHQTWARRVVNSRGETFTAQFSEPGTFSYFCEFHGSPGAGMNGTITVTP